MSSISFLHRACLRLALLPLPPLRARATTLRPPLSQPRRYIHLSSRSAMSSAACRLSHIAAATSGGGGTAGESNESPPAASAPAQEDDGTSRSLRSLGAIVALGCWPQLCISVVLEDLVGSGEIGALFDFMRLDLWIGSREDSNLQLWFGLDYSLDKLMHLSGEDHAIRSLCFSF